MCPNPTSHIADVLYIQKSKMYHMSLSPPNSQEHGEEETKRHCRNKKTPQLPVAPEESKSLILYFKLLPRNKLAKCL